MTHALTSQDIALGNLIKHPANVRADTSSAYAPEELQDLKASIAVLGLIQPPLVQKIDGKFGVLAGGRRHAALLELVADKAVKGFTLKTKIACRVVPDDCDVTTAMSLAENVHHAQMNPIEEFEAYARMMEVDKQTPDTIAMTFGTTVAAVKERLRYGLVHPDIRQAAREKSITLDAMKAFAHHPSTDVQKEVYDALTTDGSYLQAYTIRSAMNDRGTKVSDALGAFVEDAYRAKDGPIAADLLEEHSVLEDTALVEAVLVEKLEDAAQAKCSELGFAWSDAHVRMDHNALSMFGTAYPEPIEPDEEAIKRLAAIDEELAALEKQMEEDELDHDAYRALDQKAEALDDEARSLQEAFTSEDLATSGVIASWNGQDVTFHLGLIKPEDMDDDSPKYPAEADAANPAGSEPVDDKIRYAASLEADLKIERATALGAALAQNPEVCVDMVHFKLVKDVLGRSATYAIGVSATRDYEKHTKEDEIDQTPVDQLAEAQSALDFSWDEEGRAPAEQFARFRELPTAEKHKLVAFATALTVKGCLARNRNQDSLMHDLEIEIMPNLREHWTPNGAFFKRLKKDSLLQILNKDLKLTQEALNLSGSSKKDVVAFMDKLFTEPFATLSEEQRTAVENWCPPQMQTTGGYSPEALTATMSDEDGSEVTDEAMAA